jgi:hypothetical protein
MNTQKRQNTGCFPTYGNVTIVKRLLRSTARCKERDHETGKLDENPVGLLNFQAKSQCFYI